MVGLELFCPKIKGGGILLRELWRLNHCPKSLLTPNLHFVRQCGIGQMH